MEGREIIFLWLLDIYADVLTSSSTSSLVPLSMAEEESNLKSSETFKLNP